MRCRLTSVRLESKAMQGHPDAKQPREQFGDG
jgi:hypothetical protein